MAFNLSLHKDLFSDFKKLENLLLKIYKELPEEWFIHKNIHKSLTSIEKALETNIKKIDKSKWGKIEEIINKQFEKFIRKIRVHLLQLKKHLDKIRGGKIRPGLTATVKETMKGLIDELHTLHFYVNLYPVNKIKDRKVWKTILTGLRKGTYIPSDINQDAAANMVKHFTDAELILSVQFNTADRPYLMITLSRNKIGLQIIKKGHIKRNELVISRIMSLLEINHMVIDFKHKMIDDKVEHMNNIGFMNGIPIAGLGRMKDRNAILSFAFLLGAACADGFALNLSDRPLNVYIDYNYFMRIKDKNPAHFIGMKNPIFHVDYDFLETGNIAEYLHGQLFGPRGLFVIMFVDNVDLVKAKLSIREVTRRFNQGYISEIKRIKSCYIKNKQAIDIILYKNNISYLVPRFLTLTQEILMNLEEQLWNELKVKEYRLAA